MASLLAQIRRKQDRDYRIVEHARQYICHEYSIYSDRSASDAFALLWSLTLNYWHL